MRLFLSSLALLTAFTLPALAHAGTLDFTISGEGDNYNFSLPSNPTPDEILPGPTPLDLFFVTITDNGGSPFSAAFAVAPDVVGFFPELALNGDLSFLGGTSEAPTFAPGTFSLENANDDAPYTITIASIASTPEPSSLALLGTGALGAIGLVRRRIVR
jgi:PEP-CTERM motif